MYLYLHVRSHILSNKIHIILMFAVACHRRYIIFSVSIVRSFVYKYTYCVIIIITIQSEWNFSKDGQRYKRSRTFTDHAYKNFFIQVHACYWIFYHFCFLHEFAFQLFVIATTPCNPRAHASYLKMRSASKTEWYFFYARGYIANNYFRVASAFWYAETITTLLI